MPARTTREPGAGPVATGVLAMAVLMAVLAVVVQSYFLYRPEGPAQPGWLPYGDKIGHLLGFAVPVTLVLFTIRLFAGQVSRATIVVVVIAFAGQAVLSEFVQARFLPGRTGDAADLVADGLGIVLGVLGARAAWPVLSRISDHRSRKR